MHPSPAFGCAQVSLRALPSTFPLWCAFLSYPIHSSFSLQSISGLMPQQRQVERVVQKHEGGNTHHSNSATVMTLSSQDFTWDIFPQISQTYTGVPVLKQNLKWILKHPFLWILLDLGNMLNFYYFLLKLWCNTRTVFSLREVRGWKEERRCWSRHEKEHFQEGQQWFYYSGVHGVRIQTKFLLLEKFWLHGNTVLLKEIPKFIHLRMLSWQNIWQQLDIIHTS